MDEKALVNYLQWISLHYLASFQFDGEYTVAKEHHRNTNIYKLRFKNVNSDNRRQSFLVAFCKSNRLKRIETGDENATDRERLVKEGGDTKDLESSYGGKR